MKRKHLTDEEIKQLAEDLYKGLIFTDRHIHDPKLVPMVFMPLVFLDKKQIDEIQEDFGFMYEYMSEAGPRAINDMPMFTSAKIVNKEDAKKVFEKYEQIKSAVDNI